MAVVVFDKVIRIIFPRSLIHAVHTLLTALTILLFTYVFLQNGNKAKTQLYNLMEESYGELWEKSFRPPGPECTIEYANANRLEQNHPCVIELIRSQYLFRPAPPDVPLRLSQPEVIDPSSGQSKKILSLLNNQTGGFFVECGALDGEFGSNTLFMEQHLNWKGILIEPDMESFRELLTKRRHAWTLPLCLGTKPYPTKVSFESNDDAGKIHEPADGKSDERLKSIGAKIVQVQCFPLFSILLAVGRTRVDYFSLDVEGSESQVLMNVPWHLVDIKALTVEITSRNKQITENLNRHMELNGYDSHGLMIGTGYYDMVYLKRN